MIHPRNNPGVMEVVDPPRDGEFFFEESAEGQSGESHYRSQVIGGGIWSLAVAAALGMVVGWAVLKF